MKRKALLLALATVFLLLLNISIRSHLEQSSTADVPSLSADFNEAPSVESSSSLVVDQDLDDPGSETDAFSFLANPSADYYEMNADYVGWLKIGGTVIDYPVVRGQDNEFYLEHDFYKEEHILGSIFMDYRNIGMGLDDHTILYGHYTQTGLMFADLDKFLSEDFTKENPTISFQDPYTKRTYKIFSVHVTPAGSDYIRTSFDGNELKAYYEELKADSVYPIESEFKADQKLLTLISCNYSVDDGRVYVHAYEVTEE
ncbi:sortase, SrtB family [Alkalibacterium subtropicum]|uniref:Sortase, SrtB family n=1 Tax=Alkalibacterium subtropicum TaxID=753702 RepID=A0A1I1JUD3_9LACT|nr:class B sortase [Alkalibacterium subtropicum]SFC52267.1 sortase, SrtB family [Alkalibacterium subtropicum]